MLPGFVIFFSVAKLRRSALEQLAGEFALALPEEVVFDQSGGHGRKWIGSDIVPPDCRLVITNIFPGKTMHLQSSSLHHSRLTSLFTAARIQTPLFPWKMDASSPKKYPCVFFR